MKFNRFRFRISYCPPFTPTMELQGRNMLLAGGEKNKGEKITLTIIINLTPQSQGSEHLEDTRMRARALPPLVC